MPKSKYLYIDSEGIKRGYYVYLHKNNVTGEVFYVGKGYGRRAWERNKRNADWKRKVASMQEGWDVEIVQDDLSEIEAFTLEAELVKNYGGASANGGTLTNQYPGGEEPLEVGISFVSERLELWSKAYYEAREFKAIPRTEQESIAMTVTKKLEPFIDDLSDVEQKADESKDEKLADSASSIEGEIRSILDASSEFIRHRVSWKDFGLTIEEALDQIEFEMEECHSEILPLLKEALTMTKEIFTKIDSGNREKAEEFASLTVDKINPDRTSKMKISGLGI